jgi:hypothetical protein
LPPGPAQTSSQAASGPSSGARASSSAASWLPSSCTAARPSRTEGTRAGSPPPSRTAWATTAPGCPPDSASELLARYPAGDQVHLGRGVVGQQRRLQLGLVAQRVAPGLDRPSAGGRWPAPTAGRRPPRAAPARPRGPRPAATLRSTALTRPGGAGADDRAGERHGRVDGGVRRHPQVEQLVGRPAAAGRAPAGPARPAAGRPAGRGPRPACRWPAASRRRAGWRRRRPRGSSGALAQQLGQQQVGVGRARVTPSRTS